ncbi:MAG: hypothetical protein M1158_00390 [Candidatus Marsarchaeota archaeon]|nr:hypothetical protein [Candidatus Marsarchaeota archaeon]
MHKLFNSLERFTWQFDASKIPLNGIYVFFEKGERSHGFDRIVRIGTHNGQNQLRSRLAQHLINENKDRSIFRKNVGRAIISKSGDMKLLEMWEKDRTTRKGKSESKGFDMDAITKVENEVSEYMRKNLSFVVFEVGAKEDRLALESKLISTVSLCDACKPSPDWLGNFSSKQKIRESGLWLVNELYKKPMSYVDIEELGARLGLAPKP